MSNFITLDDLFLPFWDGLKDRNIFCGFKLIGEQKVPVGVDGQAGLGADASIERFGTYQQIKDMNLPFVGLSLMNPIEVDNKYLVCLDFDWKRAPEGKAEPEQLELMAMLTKLGAYYETSYSGKGAHYWVLSKLDNIPRSIKLANKCEIEVFSGFPDARSNVLITDYDIEGELKQINIKAIWPKVKEAERKPAPKLGNMTVNIADNLVRAKEVLRYIPADDYEIWIRVGMILKGEFGDNAYDLWNTWSSQSESYDPEIMFNKWASFNGSGLGMGTLVQMGQDFGYEVPHAPKSTPLEDFGIIDTATGELIIEQPPKESLLDKAYISPMKELTAPQWVVDGIIPNGVGVIAGVGGVGKTTAIMPLAATVAGFDDHLSDIKVKIERHVLYITEDSVQAQKAIYAIKTWRKSKKDINQIYDYIHLYNSNQYRINDLRDLLTEAVERYSTEYRGIMFAPLVIFDTASANIAVDNENDNAEISKYMTMFKQLWARYSMPIWLVNHLAKSANGMSIDELDAHSARGASAWRDNSNWTANLAIDKGSENRVLHMMKVREELTFNEILFESTTHDVATKDIFGDDVVVTYRYCTARRSNTGKRLHEKDKTLEDAILKVVKETAYTCKNQISELVTGSRKEILARTDYMIKDGKLKVLPLPEGVHFKGRSTFITSSP